MTQIDIDEATPDWLDAFLKARHGGLGSHVPRTEGNARMWYIGHKLGILLHEGIRTETPGFIIVRTFETLSAEHLTTFMTTEIHFGGRTHRFDALEADRDWNAGTNAGAFVELTYKAIDL